MQKLPIYLDYMATTPIDERVIQEMLKYMGVNSEYGNSSSLQHIYGQNAATAIDAARATIAATVGANSEDIIFIKSQYVNEELDGSKYPVSKLSYDLFSNLVDLSKSRWIACLGIIGDNGYSSWEPFFNEVMHEDNISIEELR